MAYLNADTASTDAYLASVFSLAKVAIAYVLFRLETAYFIFYILACVGTSCQAE
jgi:hypothetical protein